MVQIWSITYVPGRICIQYHYIPVLYNTSDSSSTHDIDTRTTTRPRHTSSAAAYTDWSGHVQAHTRPALSRELSVRHRGERCGGCVSHRQELPTSPSYCCCCEPDWVWSCPTINTRKRANTVLSTGRGHPASGHRRRSLGVEELRAQRRHVLGNGGRGSILTALPFSHSSTIRVPAANWCLLYKYTWYLVRVVSLSYEKLKCVFLRRAADKILYSYKEIPKWSHKQKGQTGSFLNLKKSWIINGLRYP